MTTEPDMDIPKLISFVCLRVAQTLTAADQPNLVIIFTDDQGYGDLSCYGAEHVSTPRIDQMALEGSRPTSFYVAAPVYTFSRAALMTSCDSLRELEVAYEQGKADAAL